MDFDTNLELDGFEDTNLSLEGVIEDFDDIGQTSENLLVDFSLDGFDGEFVDVRAQEGFKYPSMLIFGIKFLDALRVLKEIHRESFRSVDVWMDLGDGNPPVKQGTLPMDSKTFLVMRYLGLKVTLYLSENNVQSLNLRDLDVIEQFI